MTLLLILGAVILGLGIAVGLLLPRFVEIYQLTQAAHDRGYRGGRRTMQAQVRHALGRLIECKHETPRVCDDCVSLAQGELVKLLRDE